MKEKGQEKSLVKFECQKNNEVKVEIREKTVEDQEKSILLLTINDP